MIRMALSLLGAMMLGAVAIGGLMALRVLRNERPHRPVFLLGAALTAAACVTLSISLVFNRAEWFGSGVALAAVLYIVGVTMQRRGRRQK